MNRKSTPPLINSFYKKKSYFLLILSIFLLHSCDPPSEKSKPYTTTVSGQIITPGRAANPKKGSTIAAAAVWVDPAKKILAKPNGSYQLNVTHSGSFTIKADYTGSDGDYQASAPKTFNTTARNIDNQNIALKYGHTTTVSGTTFVFSASGTPAIQNGVEVIIEVEGCVAGSAISSGGGKYTITFNHGGHFTGTASFTGVKNDSYNESSDTSKTQTKNFVLRP